MHVNVYEKLIEKEMASPSCRESQRETRWSEFIVFREKAKEGWMEAQQRDTHVYVSR